MRLQRFIADFWRSHGDQADGDHALITQILADADLMRDAVRFAVARLRPKVERASSGDERLDAIAVRRSEPALPPRVAHPIAPASRLVRDLIDHGMSLLDMRFGMRALGDYTPADLKMFGDASTAEGKIAVLRGRFALAVAEACPRKGETVRTQLSVTKLEELRDAIIDRVPDAALAATAFALRAEAIAV